MVSVWLNNTHPTSADPCISVATAITMSTPPRYKPTHMILRRDPRHRHQYFSGHFFDLILLTIVDLIRFNCGFYLIILSCGFDLIRLNCFYFIQPVSNVSIFNPCHTILITFQSVLGESHIGQFISKIFQHWNRGIFHNSDNWNWVSRKHSNRRKK